MDVLSHLLWTNLLYRNKLHREEALYFALLPDVGFLLIMGYVLFGKPMTQGWDDAMRTIPAGFLIFYNLTHSLVVFGIAAALAWRFKRELLAPMSAWLLHICMDIPSHGGMFATRFLYPLVPGAYVEGVPWTDIRFMAVAYLALLFAYIYADWRDTRKHKRRRHWTPDLFDRADRFMGGLINPKPVPVGYARGDIGGAPCGVPGEDPDGPGEGEGCGSGTVPPPQAG